MSSVDLPVIASVTAVPADAVSRDAAWLRTARRARVLSWLSLAWTTVEGIVGLVAGLDASALSLIVWASSSLSRVWRR